MTETKYLQLDETVEVEAVRALTVYKILVLGLLWFLVPLGIAFGIAALFGANTVKWSGTPLHGALGMLLGPILAAIVGVGMGLFIGTMAVGGLWLQFRFGTMTIRFRPKGGATARHHHDRAIAGATNA